MKNNLFKKGLFLSLLTLILVFSGCEQDSSEKSKYKVIPYSHRSVAIKGTWFDSYGDVVITESVYNEGSLWSGGDIVKVVNDQFNAGDESDTAGDFGFMVVKYTKGNGKGKFGVVRWKSLKTEGGVTTMQYSEGSNYVDANNTGDYYNTPDEAELNMRDDTKFFNFYSTVTLR